MIEMLKRHEIQVLRRAAHTWSEIAALSGVSEKTARRIAAEATVTTADNSAERARRHVGRPGRGRAGIAGDDEADSGARARARAETRRRSPKRLPCWYSKNNCKPR